MIISAEKIKKELKEYLIYISLMTCISNEKYNVIKNPKLKKELLDLNEIIDNSNYNNILLKGPHIKQQLQKIVDYFSNRYPPKKSISEIAFEFDNLFKGKQNSFSIGIDFGWLESVMDLSINIWPKDLPFQTKIGIGHHAGYANIEDDFLLRDAFYTFLKSEDSYENLLKLRDMLKKEHDSIELNFDKSAYDNYTLLKFNVSAYSRLSIISFYSFIECFVNTIGFDYYYRNLNKLNEKESEILKGTKKGRYLQLEYKLEKFPKIIRIDKKQIIFIKDKKQIKEPFKTFFKEYKNLRDASIHYAPLKEKIWLSPLDWINKAREFRDLTINTTLFFWKACYPESSGPEYLGKLDTSKQIELAKKCYLIK